MLRLKLVITQAQLHGVLRHSRLAVVHTSMLPSAVWLRIFFQSTRSETDDLMLHHIVDTLTRGEVVLVPFFIAIRQHT